MKPPPRSGPCPFCEQYPCECSNWDDEADAQPKKPEATAVKEQPKKKRKRKEQG